MSNEPDFANEATQPIGLPVPLFVPTQANHLQVLSHAERCAKFGVFAFTPDPQPGNVEHVTIEHDWLAQNIVPVNIPQLPGRRTQMHRRAVDPFLALWAAWEKAKLIDRIVTFDGGFAPRYKRHRSGPAVNLSNHAWGSALDINAGYNPLGREPAPIAAKGCTRELVAIAQDRGWAWGGWFHAPDAMHFELVKP